MKKILLLFLSALLITGLKAQYACNTAVPFYSATGLSVPMNTNTTAPIGPNYGCLGSQPNPAYVLLPVCGGGTFQILLSNSANSDIDFIAWGPFYTNDINVICNTISSGSNSGVDCSYSTSSTEQIDIANAMVGEFYLIMIVNFGSVPTTANLTQTMGPGMGIADTTCNANNLNCGIYNMPVCEVTMNDSANHCKILWEKIPNLAVEKYYIHRLNAQSQYILIDSIPENDSSYYVDYSSWPSTQPYRYKINYKDSCGNYNILSGYHQSIHLQSSPGFNAVNLDWDAYVGITYPTYYILRGTDPFNMSIIDSISSAFTSFTDVNPNVNEPCYQVGIVNPNPCQITRAGLLPVVSNVFNTNPNSLEEIQNNLQLKLYPNPVNTSATFEMNLNNIKNPSLKITDLYGREIFSQLILNSKTEIEMSNYAKGIYFYSILDNGNLIQTEKFIVQ